MEILENVFASFVTKGALLSIEEIGNGHINKTYLVQTTQRSYILQRINNHAFNDVKGLMNNLLIVTDHLIENDVFTIKFKPTYEGKLFLETSDGFYRLYKYIPNTITYEGVDNLEVIEKSGYAFGQFHHYLSDLDPTHLIEVIPNFHNTPKRFESLLKSIKADPIGRVENVKDIIKFLVDHQSDLSKLTDALDKKLIPLSVTHNDPKINNILFDENTNDVKCVIDLDTVMSGTVLYDFGDALRSLMTGANEDTNDLSLIKFKPDIYEAYLRGYYSQMKDTLNAKEIELLPYAPLVLTLELVIRFLTDYIDGDLYFATNYSEHNLVRTKTQLKLAQELYSHFDELISITKKITNQ